MAAPSAWNLGFLTVLHEASGFLGGYLVTNQWGRPLEFRLSNPVQPNRVQQILYGATLENYLCADLIGKTLLDKTSTPAQLVVTDKVEALDLRWRIDLPVGLLGEPREGARAGLKPHSCFPQDEKRFQELLDNLNGALDLSEPFARIREAIAEARKLGVTGRG